MKLFKYNNFKYLFNIKTLRYNLKKMIKLLFFLKKFQI